MRNDYFLRMDSLPDEENAAEQRLERTLQHKAPFIQSDHLASLGSQDFAEFSQWDD